MLYPIELLGHMRMQGDCTGVISAGMLTSIGAFVMPWRSGLTKNRQMPCSPLPVLEPLPRLGVRLKLK